MSSILTSPKSWIVEFLFLFEQQSFGSLGFLLRAFKELMLNLYR
jgi:hypothetical protein